jgi:hypothetical protein
MKNSLFILFAFLFLAISCQKDELTLPTKVLFKFGMLSSFHDDEIGNKNIVYSPQFIIDKGHFVFENIEFDGRRDEGKDVFFISNFPAAVEAVLENQETNFEVKFDIPQGVYNKIDISFYIDNSQQIPIILEGKFKTGVIEKNIRFEYNHSEKISVRASNKQNPQNSIVLRKDESAIAFVIVDTEFLFRFISISAIMNAESFMINNNEVILINNQYNSELFNQIAGRISNCIYITFE